MTKQKWPERITDSENSEYLEKILAEQAESIQSAVFSHHWCYDKYVECDLEMVLNIGKQKVLVTSENKEFQNKLTFELAAASDFVNNYKCSIDRREYKNCYYRRKKLTKATISKLKPDDILYAELSNLGAMGDPGGARLITKSADYYYCNILSSDKEANDGYSELQKLLADAQPEKIIHCYGGAGNQAYKCKDAVFERDDQLHAFSCSGDWGKISFYPSCKGVYNRIADAFARTVVSIDKLKEWIFSHEEKLLLGETLILKYYLASLDNSSATDTTLEDYLNVIAYARMKNNLDSPYDCEDWIEKWEHSLAKYRLKYILDKEKDEILADMPEYVDSKKVKPGDLFKIINNALGEDITELFFDRKPELLESFDIDASSYCEFPTVKKLPKAEHERTVAKILSMNGDELALAERLGYYFANCINDIEQVELVTLLPAALHVLRELSTETEHTDTRMTYWAASDIVNKSWQIIDEPEAPKQFEKDIYDACWPRIGDIWPIEHIGEYVFMDQWGETNELADYCFNECLGYLVALPNLKDFNPELYQYFCGAHETLSEMVNARTVEERCKKLTDEAALLEYLTFDKYSLGSAYPSNKKRAKILFGNMISKTGKDYSYNKRLWFDTYSSMHHVGVGSYLIELLTDNFEKVLKIFDESEMVELFYAACNNAEVDMAEPLEALSKKVLRLKCVNKADIRNALAFVKNIIRTIKVQRKSLLKAYENKTDTALAKPEKLKKAEIEQLRAVVKLGLERRCMSTGLIQDELASTYGDADAIMTRLLELGVIGRVRLANMPSAVLIASMEEFEEKIK